MRNNYRTAKRAKIANDLHESLPNHIKEKFRKNRWQVQNCIVPLSDDVAQGLVYELRIPTKSENVSVSYLYLSPNSEYTPLTPTDTTEYLGDKRRKKVTKCTINNEQTITGYKTCARIVKSVKIRPKLQRPDPIDIEYPEPQPRPQSPKRPHQTTLNFDQEQDMPF